MKQTIKIAVYVVLDDDTTPAEIATADGRELIT